MKIIKRSGVEAPFDLEKITAAVVKANESVSDVEKMTPEQIAVISANMRTICEGMNRGAERGGDPGSGGEPDHEPEGFFGGQELYTPTVIRGRWSGSPILPTSRF